MQIEGRNTIIESLRAGKPFKKIFLELNINVDNKIQTIIDLANQNSVRIEYQSRKYLDKISKTYNHQGVIGIKLQEEELNLEEVFRRDAKHDFVIYIREALYENNVGAIVRTAEACGAKGVIVPPKVEITAQVVRAAMGGTEHIPVVHASLFQAIKAAKDEGFKVVGIELTGTHYYFESDFTGSVMFIIGGEDRSLSQEITEKCDVVVKIPMFGNVNSLNMSVAASIVVYDKIRQELSQKP